jgi:hypothetical protein
LTAGSASRPRSASTCGRFTATRGYINLAELEEVNVHRGLVIVERDLHWEPCKFGDITEVR